MEIKKNKYVELTDEMLDKMDLGKSLPDLILEAHKQALKEGIRANTIAINKRLVKSNRFVQHLPFPNSYMGIPPMICGLEAFVTDEIPDEFAFSLFEAPCTKREQQYNEAYNLGYNNAMREIKEMTLEQIANILEGDNED